MIGSGFFGTGNRYIINTFIVQEMAPSSCPFESGLVTMANTKGVKPASTWAATSLAYQAWEAAIRNEAMVGIYAKVNNDVDNFFPGERDVLGNWDCAKGDIDTIIQPDEVCLLLPVSPIAKIFLDFNPSSRRLVQCEPNNLLISVIPVDETSSESVHRPPNFHPRLHRHDRRLAP